MQAGLGLLVSDMMPIYMIIALDIIKMICFSINCPTVISLPTVCYLQERSLYWKLWPPGLLFHILKVLKLHCCDFTLYILFFIFYTCNFIFYFIIINKSINQKLAYHLKKFLWNYNTEFVKMYIIHFDLAKKRKL